MSNSSLSFTLTYTEVICPSRSADRLRFVHGNLFILQGVDFAFVENEGCWNHKSNGLNLP